MVARERSEVRPALERVQEAAASGAWALGFVSYEAAPAFDSAFRVRGGGELPLCWFGLYPAGRVEVRAPGEPPPSWYAGRSGGRAEVEGMASETEAAVYRDRVRELRRRIGRGDLFQACLTVRLRGRLRGSPVALFERMRRAQGPGYHALLRCGEHAVLSASPELFLRVEGDRVAARPMKGTAARGRWLAEDREVGERLRASEKDRAENLMIVDLTRNDLSRVCRPGTLEVADLFAVESYRTVHQMVSEVRGRLRPGVGLPELLDATFPPGSVTGAPKVQATRAIAELEQSPRGVYTGAVGLLEPGGRTTLSVAIRTAVAEVRTRRLSYGTGGAVTWDSDPDAELEETEAKARIVGRWPATFRLLETMRLEEGGVARRDRHLERLARTARYFDFDDPRPAARRRLERAVTGADSLPARVRLLADESGGVELEVGPLPRTPSRPEVVLASTAVDRSNPFLYHKTTWREPYENRRREDAFDVLLYNEEGRVTEFCTGNVVYRLGGSLWTPPRGDGLLAGTFRAELLARDRVEVRPLELAELSRGRELWHVNSLRGATRVRPAGTGDR